jgi:hypothetical protein
MIGIREYTFTPSIPSDEFADIASQLEEILSELNQVSDATLRRSMLAAMRLLTADAHRLARARGNRVQIS